MNSRLLLVATAVVVAAGALFPTHPDPPELEKFSRGIVGRTDAEYYDVHGRTPREVAESMQRLGAEINASLGHTRASYRWTWHARNDGAGQCDLTSVQVTMVSRPALPRWTPLADTVPGIYAEWQRFTSALEQHERGHKDITARGAQDILEGMLALKTFCSQVPRDLKRLTDSIIGQTRGRQTAYDAMTHDGEAQGAVFLTRLP